MNTHLDTYILSDFLDERTDWKRPLVLICPGGAYRMTSNREAEPIALEINSMGYHVAILRYSCAPAHYPTALCETALCVKLLRERAKEWHIDPGKIIVMGFSAGGHLAASYGVFWNEDFLAKRTGCSREALRPNGLMLCYPVISSDENITHKESMENLMGDRYKELKEKMSLEKQVGTQVPKTFLWHSFEDTCVPFWNSFRFAEALGKEGIPVEFHLYPEGRHGIGLGTEAVSGGDMELVSKACMSWMPLAKEWLKRNFGF